MLPTLRVLSPALKVTVGASASLAAVVSMAPAAGATPAAAPATTPTAVRVPVPARPSGLPADIEPYAAYVQDNSCDLQAKPGTLALSRLLTRTYPTTGINSMTRTCGTDTLVSYSEHYDGRSIDWGVSVRNSSKQYGDAFVKWAVGRDAQGVVGGNARRLGIMYIIWNNQQWVSWAPQKGWFDYRGCSTNSSQAGTGWDSTCHRNHVHVTLSWEGAMKRTSWWTGRVAAQDFGPCRADDLNWSSGYDGFNPVRCAPEDHVSAEDDSSALHKALVNFSGITVRQGMLGPVVKAIQQLVGVTADGDFGPATAAAVAQWQQAHGLSGDGVVGYATWREALQDTRPSLRQYYRTVLRVGSTGPAVKALQERLGGLAVDGDYGPGTAAAVNEFKASKGLPTDGVVGRGTWLALDARTATTATPPAPQPAPKPAPKPAPQPAPQQSTKPAYAAYYHTALRYRDHKPAVRVLKRALGGLPDDQVFGGGTRRKVNALKSANGLRADGVVGTAVWHILGRDFSPWYGKTLHRGSRGRSVKVLQTALGGAHHDGVFTRGTERKVNRVKRAHHLPVNGVVGRGTWHALSAH